MALDVRFYRGLKSQYEQLEIKDKNAFYYITDDGDGQLYLGEVKISNAEDLVAATAKITANETEIKKLQGDISKLIGGEEGETIDDIIDKKLKNYIVSVDDTEENPQYAKIYKIKQGSTVVGTINIPTDMVVKSAEIVELKEPDEQEHPKGTYLVLTISNSDEDKVWIDVSKLANNYQTEQEATEVQLTIDDASTISAKIVDGGISSAKLDADLKAAIDKAKSAIQSIVTGETPGTIKVGEEEVAVAGLGTAAYKDATEFEAAGNVYEAEQRANEYTDAAMTWRAMVAPVTKATTDGIITTALGDMNEAMSTYANVTLENSAVKVGISDGTQTVIKVYTDMFQKLLQTLKDNADKYSKVVGKNGTAINITEGNVQATEVVNFVKAVIPDVSGQTKLQDLYGRSFAATFHCTDGSVYTYTVMFSQIN